MSHAAFRSPDGTPIEVSATALASFRDELECTSVGIDDPHFDEIRQIWNAMIDRRPGLIVRCRHAEDVQRCVQFAGHHGIGVSVRGGGHNIGGRALADGKLLIDLSSDRSVQVDAETRTVVVRGGGLLSDVDTATAPHGLVVPTGIISETGIAGLTLGGGFGWLSRRFGLTCDHLRRVELVTSEGVSRAVDDEHHPELIWALRGGGGAPGVVTSFEFRAQRLNPMVVGGPHFRAPDELEDAIDRFRRLTARAPDELGCMLKLAAAPAAPFLPTAMHGRPVATTIVCHTGDAGRIDGDLDPLRSGVQPAADLIVSRPFVALQSMFDGGERKGRRNYWKSEYIGDLDDAIVAGLLDATQHLPSSSANIKVFFLGGAVSRISHESSAAAHRDARFIVVAATAWDDPAHDEANIGWVRETHARVYERSGRGGYINFLTEDVDPRERATAQAGVDLARLELIRRRYDPNGLFV